MESKNAFRPQIQKRLLYFILVFILLDIGSLVFLGVGFFLIIHGLLMVCIRLPRVSKSMRLWVERFSSYKPGESLPSIDNISVWRKIFLMAPAAVYILMAVAGIWILLQNGFLNQNLIYLFFRK